MSDPKGVKTGHLTWSAHLDGGSKTWRFDSPKQVVKLPTAKHVARDPVVERPADLRQAQQVIERGTPTLGHGGNSAFLEGRALAMARGKKAGEGSLLARIFGTFSDRELKKLDASVKAAGKLEVELERLDDATLRARSEALKARARQGVPAKSDQVEAMALVRETSGRVLGLRHFDVQLKGGLVLDQGRIAEMKTGEGKTLVATVAAFLNALNGKGVHVVTVNDYLAKRDIQWMGPIYHALGVTVGVLQSDGTSYVFDPGYQNPDPRFANLRPVERREAYAADITYGTNNEFGFDFLRDNIAEDPKDIVQRGHACAILDEVDNILIDEARTPMIISGPASGQSEVLCREVDAAVKALKKAATIQGDTQLEPGVEPPGDYIFDEKARNVYLTEEGQSRIADLLGVDTIYGNPELVLRVQQALVANVLFKRDHDYILQGGQVVIVDEHTGRPSPSRSWSDGLHQAVEAKVGLKIHQESETIASISVQNYFRMYEKLSGMTGTAATEAKELGEIYGLDVVVLPPNKKSQRADLTDTVYLTEAEKKAAVLDEIRSCYERGQPVLLGTISVEESAAYAESLAALGIPHQVLNARHHEAEARIVAQAGRSRAVTIATDMAGRGTDIALGGNADFLAAQLLAQGGVPNERLDPALVEKAKAEVERRQRDGLLVTPDVEAYARALVQARSVVKADRARVVEAGGLHVIGTTRHDSRRIDDQLAGRAGRQGDPGSSHFFLSLDDPLLRIFGGGALSMVRALWKADGAQGAVPAESDFLDEAIRKAQEKIEQRDYGIREQLLKYDDVENLQRKQMYADRRPLIEGQDVQGVVDYMITQVLDALVANTLQVKDKPVEACLPALRDAFRKVFGVELGITKDELITMKPEVVQERLEAELSAHREDLEARLGAPLVRELERSVMLGVIDDAWREQMSALDYLRRGIHLRAYAQQDPLVAFKQDAYKLFTDMQSASCEEIVRQLLSVERQLAPRDSG